MTNVWIALIVLQLNGASPQTISETPAASANAPLSVTVGTADSTKAQFTMDVNKGEPPSKIDRMTGIETDVIVNVPTSTTLSFPTEELCGKAADTLRRQTGILSVSCIQTQ